MYGVNSFCKTIRFKGTLPGMVSIQIINENFCFPDKYFTVFFIKVFTRRNNIDSINSCLVTKIVLPHVKTTAFRNTNFKNYDWFTPESAEMPFINIKIVGPFINTTFAIISEIFFYFIPVLFNCLNEHLHFLHSTHCNP